MSISTLVRRRIDREERATARQAADQPTPTTSDAAAAVAAYIPSEVIAAYTLVLSLTVADGVTAAGTPEALAWPAFFGFLAGTPLFVWLSYAVARVGAGLSVPWSPRQWPYWEAVAAVVAFTVWSAVMPKSAFLAESWYSAAWASVALFVASIVLPLVGTVVTRQPRS